MADLKVTVLPPPTIKATLEVGQGPAGPAGPPGPQPDLSDDLPQPLGVAAAGNSTEASPSNHVHAHGAQAGGSLHALADGSAAGFMAPAQVTKLAAIESGAQVNTVTGVFGRVGAVVATLGDYAAQLISYAGDATGSTVKAALDWLAQQLAALLVTVGTLSTNLTALAVTVASKIGFSDLVVANLTALALVNGPDGSVLWVRTLRDQFVATNLASPRTVDSITVVTHPAGGNWRWERLCLPNGYWNQQADWAIDPTNGSDENVGTAASPLKTSDELQRRVGMWGNLPLNCVIQVLSDFPTYASFRLYVTLQEVGHALTIKGTRTQLATGALTGYTALTRTGAGARNSITASFDFTNYVDKYIRLTSGPGLGYGAWIQVGANGSAQTTPWCLEHTNDTTGPASPPTLQPAGIVAGATFEILNMVNLGSCPVIRIQGGGAAGNPSLRTATTSMQIRWVRSNVHSEINYAFDSSPIEAPPGIALSLCQTDLQSGIAACQARHQGCLVGGGIFTTGYIGNAVRFHGGGTRARTPLHTQLAVGGGMVTFDGDFVFNSRLDVGVASSSVENFAAGVRLGTVFFANPAGDGILVGQNAAVQQRIGEYGITDVYGTATLRGIRVLSGGKYIYTTTKPRINDGLGLTREVVVGGTDRLYATQIPYVEGNNNAMIVAAA